MQQYSVLMSVYYKEQPEHFREAMRSILEQTARTDDFVIVCDGPLTPELDSVLEEMVAAYPDVIHPVRLEENRGIGYAANIGTAACRHELVAKMDADDIAVPNRCEQQLKCFEANPELTLCGGFIEEFDVDPNEPFAVRSVPLSHREIWEKGRRRQPFNNTTIMYRRSAVIAVGGYRDLRRNEDYDLYARLLFHGYQGQNIPQTLVRVRVDREANSCRGSLATLKGCICSRWHAYQLGYTRLIDFLYCAAGQFFLVICPGFVQQWIYVHFLRSKN